MNRITGIRSIQVVCTFLSLVVMAGCFGGHRAEWGLGASAQMHRFTNDLEDGSSGPELRYEGNTFGTYFRFSSYMKDSNQGGEIVYRFGNGPESEDGGFANQEFSIAWLVGSKEDSPVDFEFSMGALGTKTEIKGLGQLDMMSASFGARLRFNLSSPVRKSKGPSAWPLGLFLQPTFGFTASPTGSLSLMGGEEGDFAVFGSEFELALYNQIDCTMKWGVGARVNSMRLKEVDRWDMSNTWPGANYVATTIFFELMYDF